MFTVDDVLDGLFKPIFKLILAILRILHFIAWDLMFSFVGWSIGWCFLRVITFGYFPSENIGELESCSWVKALFVEIVGLVILCALTLSVIKLLGLI